uniref:Uncharacterized protein n=1 Tax=Opuntia streptacantha TaxID=393608 RepID=A0A7C9DL89_OPUST
MLLQGIRNMFNNPSTSIVEKFIFHIYIVMCKEGPRCRMEADIDFLPSQPSQATYHFLFHKFMIFNCILSARLSLCSLFCFGDFRSKMRTIRGNRWTILYVHNMLITIQRLLRELRKFILSPYGRCTPTNHMVIGGICIENATFKCSKRRYKLPIFTIRCHF